LPLSCEVVEKKVVWGPRFVRGCIPQISDMRFKIALATEHMTDFGLVETDAIARLADDQDTCYLNGFAYKVADAHAIGSLLLVHTADADIK